MTTHARIKVFLLLIICCLSLVLQAQPKETNKKILLKGSIHFKNAYCGGAYPPPEVRLKYEEHHPLKNASLILKTKTNPIREYRIKTNKDGRFSVQLPGGVYQVFMTADFDKTIGCNFSSDCAAWLSTSFAELTLTKNKLNHKMLLQFGCNPCLPPRP